MSGNYNSTSNTSQPIPISTPPHQMSSNATSAPRDTPASSVSMSPQTPFMPVQNLSSTAPNPNSGILQWARSFKSPPPTAQPQLPLTGDGHSSGSPPGPAGHQQQKGFDIPAIHASSHDHDHDHDDEHDSFEFGDISTRSWGRMGRRAVSMSVPAGQGISSMLTGFGSVSGPSGGGGPTSPPKGLSPDLAGSGAGSSVLADKTARGQGVLRRLSIGGGFAKSPMFSPPLPQQQPTASTLTASAPAPAQDFSPPAADQVQRANTLGPGGRGRRLSDSGGKKRGVSPMGERLLRDHGHF